MRTVLTENDFVARPWKNLRGTTLDLYKYPRGSGEDFLFRLSRADLTASGPFSSFPGIDRILVVTEGQEITLTVSGKETQLPLWVPFFFRGEESAHAGVASPGKDFNLMLRRGAVTGSVEVVSGRMALRVDADFFAVFSTGPLELILIENERGTEVTVDRNGKYLVIRVNKG